ncbi:MAG: hypothetical protein P9F75_12080 [Candidatus Contendobacter sp.]|nr:hypothetical protein [Candidatus Contendobacter sp.]
MSPKAQLLPIDDQPANLNTLARALAERPRAGCGRLHRHAGDRAGGAGAGAQCAGAPLEAAAEQAEGQRQGIQSLVTMALYSARGALTGFIGFDSVRGARAWSAEE